MTTISNETLKLEELKWIIKDYFPRHLELLLNLLGTCRSACNGGGLKCPVGKSSSPVTPIVQGPNQSIVFPSATLVLSTVGTDMLKGFVTLDGHRIGRAEIQLHFPTWNKGHPMSIQLDPEQPVDLPQIFMCSTLVDLAILVIRKIQSELFPLTIVDRFQEALEYCERATQILEDTLNDNSLVQAKLIGAPDDLTLSFGIQHCRIVAVVQSVQNVSQSLTIGGSSTSSLRPGSRVSLMGSSFTSPPPEVLVQVDSVVPALTAAHELLQHCAKILTRLRNQIQDLL